jgi:hypothetical protein
VITGLSQANPTFAVGTKPTPQTAATRKPKVGTTFRMTLSELSAVTIKFNRLLPGRRSGKRCVRQTTRNRKARKCTRRIAAGSLTRNNRPAGRLSVPFSGRIGKKALAVGSYEAVIQATDPAKNRSTAKSLKFKIVKR